MREKHKNIVVYMLSKYSQITQGTIAEKLNIKNSSAVGQRIYKIKKRLKIDVEFSNEISSIENMIQKELI